MYSNQSNLLQQNITSYSIYNTPMSVFEKYFQSLPYQYKQEEICSIEILIDESLSILSTDECFIKTYSKQNMSYIAYIIEKERASVKKIILSSAVEKKPFSIIHTTEKKENSFCFVHLNGIFIREENSKYVYALLLLHIPVQKYIKMHQINKNTPLLNQSLLYNHKNTNNITPFSFSKNHALYKSISFYYDTEKDIVYLTKIKQTSPFSPKFYTFTLQQLKKTNWIYDDDKEHLSIFLEYCKNTFNQTIPLQTQIRILSENKTYQWFFILLYPLWLLENTNYIFGTITPLSFPKKKEQIDSLTGLYKRAVFEEYVQSSLYHPLTKQAAFILIELSNLDKICKAVGKPLKNMALQDIVKNIKLHFRQTDLLSKYNHNTIAIYLPNMTSKIALEKKLDAMKFIFDTPYGNAQKDYTTIGYTGISLYPENGTSYKSLLDCASKALQKAQENTKNRFLFYEKTFL